MNAMHSLLIVQVAAWTTIVTRAFPFVLLRNRPLSPFLRYLSAILPSAIIVILLVYCLRASFGLPLMEALPSFLALGAVFLLHRIRHNMLLSIGGATVLYMVLLRLLPLL